MSWHENKRVLVGVSGAIAAYKSPALVRCLVQRGCEVRVVMTRAAEQFITPLTLQAVSGHPVCRHLLSADTESGMGHIELARWAEVIVVAPAGADCIARLAHGRADDLLAAVVLAAAGDVEVAVAPAMNRQMWESPATQRNLAELAQRGVRIIGPAAGDQACGETGPGRMTEPDDIAAELIGDAPPLLLDGVEALITAGPTWEALDPVRGLTNRSSGKMGYALARAARDFGARVTLVSGPVTLDAPNGVRRVDVGSAEEMLEAVMAEAPAADWFIGVAAVADYRPARVAAHKIAKKDARMRIELVRNPDILAAVAAMKRGPFTLGFAAETENVIAHARQKLTSKGVDVMAANQVGSGDAGDVLGGDENAVTLLHKAPRRGDVALEKTDKYRLAVQIIEHIAPLLAARRRGGGGGRGNDGTGGDRSGA
ncbi:MAG: bifunctional phosphopantothenoylcysteine decarboxylase/phosphopantothenate--cysteine ligase CoaBC [Gammaproteobacteria bacterium]|nr:bifunctional phosphopantothenoylcysteine decarboxylase/phosphopantothenate--cysteine ligase CoaBC [Gammaproteobacteria bacterium]